jgi:hypothetical protein
MFRFIFAIHTIGEVKTKIKGPARPFPPPLLPSLPGVFLKEVRRAARRIPEFPDDVGLDHRRLDVGVTEVLLDLPGVHAVKQQVGCEAPKPARTGTVEPSERCTGRSSLGQL